MVRWLDSLRAGLTRHPPTPADVLLDRVTRLQELSAALAVAGTMDEVVTTATRSIQRATDASGASFCRVDGDRVRVEGSAGYDAEIVAELREFAVDADLPIALAIRTGTPVVHGVLADLLAQYPHLESASRGGALAVIPLQGESGVLGAIALRFDRDRSFDTDDVSFLVAVATQCATAYERAAAFESEREARRVAEAASARLAYISDATRVLSQSLDPDATLQRLAELAVPTLGDWCAVHIVEGDFAHPVAMASENPEATAMVRNLSERHPIPIDAPAGLGAVVRTGEPVIVRSVTMDAVRASTGEGEVVDLLSRLRSIAIVPMTYRGTVIGTITLSNTTERTLEDADIELAGELAARAAQAITNARLFQERNRVASTLQASLLPPAPAIIPGVDVATRFSPAQGLDVGGDFYDVFRMGTVERPAPRWALVIGDVRGKGADAAAITGTARAAIRTGALDEQSPARLLERLNDVLLASSEDDRTVSTTGEPRFCTACVVTITPTDDGADLVIAVGGHPLPYVLRADGSLEQVGRTGGLVGAFHDAGVVDVEASMRPGDALVLFTDGVTERHEGRTFFDEEGLEAVLGRCRGASAMEIAVRVERAAEGFVASEPKDDLAVVVARLPGVAAAGTVARRSLPHDDRAAGIARRFVDDALRGEAAVASIVDTAVLLTSELVTNALAHGAPQVHVSVQALDGAYRVSVDDEDPRQPVLRAATRDDEHGRGLVLVDVLANRWGVDTAGRGKSVWFELDT
jgi:serine phosphatase RsbU (regulator of sigma subunit)/anti-sigma regulatory factor (Ser/Thr protein kinase)